MSRRVLSPLLQPLGAEPDSNSTKNVSKLPSSPASQMRSPRFMFRTSFIVPPDALTTTHEKATTLIRRASFHQIRDPVSARSTTEKIRYHVESLPFRLFVVLLILCDLALLVYCWLKPETFWIRISTCAILAGYSFELIVRMCVVPNFFCSLVDVLDTVVVVSSVVLRSYELVAEESHHLQQLVKVLRIIRTLRIFIIVHAETWNISRAARRHISQNKRRFFYERYELDLTYITDRVIAMSLPATGLEAIYRNPLNHVAGYFNKRYPNHYRIYNLCSERMYNESKFENKVVRYAVDDHNVMDLEMLVCFCHEVQAFLDEDDANVVAIHCRGGKGRTGLCVCAWLVHSKTMDSAQEALDLFASRRTDTSISKHFQGVQTPSQYRYVHYYERLVRFYACRTPAPSHVMLTCIRIYNLPQCSVPRGRDTRDLITLDLQCNHRLLVSSQSDADLCQVKSDHVEFKFERPIQVHGDVKLQFFSKLIRPRRQYEKCLFYVWFNCSLEDTSHDLVFRREFLDNCHFKENKREDIFPQEMRLEVGFEESSIAHLRQVM